MGGAGKTPMVEYLLQLLHPYYKLSVLSRGYKRKTSGFRMVNNQDHYSLVGDEPLQVKAKYPHIPVAVGESRVMAIPHLKSYHPEIEIVLLDDAYQHISIKPDLNILLTNYNKPYWEDALFPAGDLREPIKASNRADIVIVTKCPPTLNEEEKSNLYSKINPAKNQKVYFTSIRYFHPYALFNNTHQKPLKEDMEVMLFSGIADNFEIISYLESVSKKVYWYSYQDHYDYTFRDLESIAETYRNLGDVPKILLTTEKDAVKLVSFGDWFKEHQLDVYCLPIQVEFLGNSKTEFDSLILDYLEFYFNK
jgi:tetraacyldisaccharide 4'-kinase